MREQRERASIAAVSRETRIASVIRLAPVKSLAVVLWGEAPVLFATLAITGLLWGTGRNLPSVNTAGGRGDARAAVAWLAAVALVLLFTYPLLGLAVRLMRGFWPQRWPYGRLAEVAMHRRRRARELRIKRAALNLEMSFGPSSESEGPDTDLIGGRIAHRFTPVVRPTALGDEEAAVADRVARRYGLDLSHTWPRLAGLIPEPERGTLADAERGVDAAVFAAAGWLVAVGWLLAASIGLSVSGVVALFTLAGAGGALALYLNGYRRAVDRTISHGRLVESAVDLHRLALLDALGWRRPKDEEEERRIFKALSAALAIGGDDGRYRRYAATSGDAADLAGMREAVNAALAGVPGAVTAGVLDGVGQGLRKTLDQALSGPRLTNFEGHLSVELLSGHDPVRPDDEGIFPVTRERMYGLVVTVGRQQPSAGIPTVPLRIRGGDDSPIVPFAVSIDSNVLTLRENDRALTVDKAAGGRLDFPLRVQPSDPDEIWLWIRVTQHDRTIQNLELTLGAEDPPG